MGLLPGFLSTAVLPSKKGSLDPPWLLVSSGLRGPAPWWVRGRRFLSIGLWCLLSSSLEGVLHSSEQTHWGISVNMCQGLQVTGQRSLSSQFSWTTRPHCFALCKGPVCGGSALCPPHSRLACSH